MVGLRYGVPRSSRTSPLDIVAMAAFAMQVRLSRWGVPTPRLPLNCCQQVVRGPVYTEDTCTEGATQSPLRYGRGPLFEGEATVPRVEAAVS